MSKINIEINTNENFGVVNPQARIIFSELYESDDSKEQQESSQFMGGLTLLHHPDSILNEFLPSEKIEYIRNSFVRKKDGTPKDEFNTEDLFKETCLTSKQRVLAFGKSKFDERNRFMDSLSYFDGDGDILEKMMEKTNKMWTEYLRAEEEVAKEREESTRGGAVESATELGKL